MFFPTRGIFPYFNFQILDLWSMILNGFVFLGLLWCCGKNVKHKPYKEDTITEFSSAENSLYQTTLISLQNAV